MQLHTAETLKVGAALTSCISAKDKHPSTPPTLVFRKAPYHLLLPLVISGNDVVGFVGTFDASRADANVVSAAVDIQQALMFFADLVLQVESRFNQSVGCHGLHLFRREGQPQCQLGTNMAKIQSTRMSDSELEVCQIYTFLSS